MPGHDTGREGRWLRPRAGTLLFATVMVFALQLRQTLRLDRPLYVQYASWLWR